MLAPAARGGGLHAALIPEALAGPDISQPVGRCHVALRRLSGRQLARAEAGSPDVLAQLARLLDALGELGRQPEIGAAIPQADPGYWELSGTPRHSPTGSPGAPRIEPRQQAGLA